MRPLPVLLLMLSSVTVSAQSLTKTIPVNLNSNEQVLSIIASSNDFAAAVLVPASPGSPKEYYVIGSSTRKGPFNQIIDFQYSFDNSIPIFGAMIDSSWYVFEGDNKYGPYAKLRKIQSGSLGKSCLYLASLNGDNPLLYNRGTVYGGIKDFTDCLDYELSENGSTTMHCCTGLMGDRVVFLNEHSLKSVNDVNALRLSADGKYSAFLYETNTLTTIISQNDKNRFSGQVSGGAGLFVVNDELVPFRSPGDFQFFDELGGYYYSFRDSESRWKLFRNNDIDMGIHERDITMLHPIGSLELAYVAKPDINNTSGLDTSAFYVYYQKEPIAGPFLEVRELAVSPSKSMAILARTVDGWFIYAPGGSIGPFRDVKNLTFFNDAAFVVDLKQTEEWITEIISSSGLQQGNIIRHENKIIGLAHFKGAGVDIYLN